MDKISLGEIFRSKEFQDRFYTAAAMSYKSKLESAFTAYSTSDEPNKIIVNRPIIGIPKKKIPLGEEFSVLSDNCRNSCFGKNKGGYVPFGGYTVVRVHFHPPGYSVLPSKPDINDDADARGINMSLAQSVTYEDENLNRQEVYINPVAIIGSVRKEMKDLDVLAYQLTAKKLSTYDSVALFFKTLENPKTARGASRILSGWRGFKAEGWKMDVGKGGKLLLPDNILDNLEKFRIVVPY